MENTVLMVIVALFAACVGVAEAAVRGDGMIPFVAVSGKPSESEVREKVASIQAQGMDSFLVYAQLRNELCGNGFWASYRTQRAAGERRHRDSPCCRTLCF